MAEKNDYDYKQLEICKESRVQLSSSRSKSTSPSSISSSISLPPPPLTSTPPLRPFSDTNKFKLDKLVNMEIGKINNQNKLNDENQNSKIIDRNIKYAKSSDAFQSNDGGWIKRDQKHKSSSLSFDNRLKYSIMEEANNDNKNQEKLDLETNRCQQIPIENNKCKSIEEEKSKIEEDTGGWIKRRRKRRQHSIQFLYDKNIEVKNTNDKEAIVNNNLVKENEKPYCTDENKKLTSIINNKMINREEKKDITNITNINNSNNITNINNSNIVVENINDDKFEINTIRAEKRKQSYSNKNEVVEVKKPREHYETKVQQTDKISSVLTPSFSEVKKNIQKRLINVERNNQNEKKTIDIDKENVKSNKKEIDESVNLQELKWTNEIPKWEIRPNDVEYIEVNSLQVCGRNFNRLFGPMAMIFDHKRLSHMDCYKELARDMMWQHEQRRTSYVKYVTDLDQIPVPSDNILLGQFILKRWDRLEYETPGSRNIALTYFN